MPAGPSPAGALLLGLGGLALIVFVRGLRSVLTEARAQLRVRSGLRAAVEHQLDGAFVRLFPSSRPQAFCAGLLRPRVFLSSPACDRLSQAELRAVVAHEGHHVRRRDPLRLLVARVLADALFFVPALRRLERRYAELAELAADEAAIRAAGSAALASALVKLGGSDHPEATVALAPERVDHLCVPTRWRRDEPRVSAHLGGGCTLGYVRTRCARQARLLPALAGDRENVSEADRYLEADVERIVRALAKSPGVLTRAQLVEELNAELWSSGRFQAALRHGLEQGRIRGLGEFYGELGEFYELSAEERSALPGWDLGAE